VKPVYGLEYLVQALLGRRLGTVAEGWLVWRFAAG
jgi:hypothetical protein